MEIPLIKNSKSNAHCAPACVRMALKSLYPKKTFGYKLFDEISKHKRGDYFWWPSMLVFLSSCNVQSIIIDPIDYREFAKVGKKYLEAYGTTESFTDMNTYSNLDFEAKCSKKMIRDKNIEFKNRPATFEDVEIYFKKSHFVIVTVNPNIFVGKAKAGLHSVLVTDIHKGRVYFNDPGLPAEKSFVTKKIFMKAMYDGDPKTSSIVVIVRPKSLAITRKDSPCEARPKKLSRTAEKLIEELRGEGI